MPDLFEKSAHWLLARGVKTRLSLCFFSGALGALALAPVSWPVFFFPGFILCAFYLRHAESVRHSFLTAFFYALGFHIAGLYWISASLFIDIARYIYVLPFSLVALPCWLAFLFALGALLAHGARHRPIFHAVFLTAGIFVSEIARGVLLSGFPWNLFGTIWAETLPLAQSVSLFGIYGLTFLTLLAASLSSLLLEKITHLALILLVLSWGTLSSLALWGELRLENTPTTFSETAHLRLVQPGITQEERRDFDQRLKALKRLIDLSKKPAATPPTHIIWAETAVPDYLANDAELRVALARLAPPMGALITGTPGRKVKDHQISYSNSLAVLTPQGAISGWYDKSHLVPFGEFIPLRGLLKMMPVATDVIGARGDFSPGPGARTLRAPGFPPFSPMICYEAIFSGQVTDRADPPEALLQITNDAWFGDTSGPYQHLQQARLRAVEEGLPLIRAANSGVSAVMDPMGRIIASLPLDATGALDAPLPLKLAHATLFSRTGTLPVFAFGFFLLFILGAFHLVNVVKRRR